MKVLITGGSGFIGYHLGKSLAEEGVHVTLADCQSITHSDQDFDQLIRRSNVEFINVDFLEQDALNSFGTKFTHIVHLAALLGVQNVIDNPYAVLDVNNKLTSNVFKLAFRQKSLRRVIFASTSEIYAGTLQSGMLAIPTPENSHLVLPSLEAPRTSYMLSKLYGEALTLHSGLPYTIIRPHNVYGPRMGMRHVIPELIKKAYFEVNGTLEVFSSEHSRTFCYVDDAVRMIKALMDNDFALNKVLNLGNQNPEIKIRELAEIVIRVLEKDLEIIDGGTTEGSPPRRAPDMSLLKTICKIESKVDISTGVSLCLDWYKKHVFVNLV